MWVAMLLANTGDAGNMVMRRGNTDTNADGYDYMSDVVAECGGDSDERC
jgi:hypothetical protein